MLAEMEVHPSLTRSFSPPSASSRSRSHNSTSSSNHHKSQTASTSFSPFETPRASGSTQHTTASTLWSPSSLSNAVASPASQQNGPVTATANVINRVAEKGSSLFQACTTLQKRLCKVPGFEAMMRDIQDTEGTASDPVATLWGVFRLGYPFLTVFNVFQPNEPIGYGDGPNEDKNRKLAVMKFIAACKQQLGFQNDECFIVQDILGNDINGFVKAVRLVGRVLDILEHKGLIEPPDLNESTSSIQASVKRTQRQHIVDELVRTERTYVQHLESIDELKMYIEQRGAIPGDPVNDIFLNIHAILDFQRRFLIRVEQVNAMSEDEQDWGELFLQSGAGMLVYGNYILNQRQCEAVSFRYHDKLREATVGAPLELRQMVESANTLGAFLLKPFQRLSKYPLLLKEMSRKGDLDDEKRRKVEEAGHKISLILENANNLVRKDELRNAYSELEKAIDDWKTHDPGKFGDLLDYGHFTVLKGSEREDRANEREYVLYMFENILLCCKDVTNKKTKLVPSNKPPPNRPSRPGQPKKYNLKGRIYPFNIEDIISFGKLDNYLLKITWYGEQNQLESLNIRFPTEETMVKWRDRLEAQRTFCKASQEAKHAALERQRLRNSDDSQYQNYQDGYDKVYSPDDLSEEGSAYPTRFSSREELNGFVTPQLSNGSLRSRSTTGDSTAPLNIPVRGQPMRQGSGAPLTLRTQHLQGSAVSPLERTGTSYFSPMGDSPISSRTSSSSGALPFSKQVTPQGTWGTEDSSRFTAPAQIARPYNREMSTGSYTGGRNPAVKSMPMHPAALAQTRSRSKSSPYTQAETAFSPLSTVQPPVPSLPPHFSGSHSAVNRSQSSTPVYANGVAPNPMAQPPNSSGYHGSYQRPFHKHGESDADFGTRSETNWSSSTMTPPTNTASSALDSSRAPHMFKIKIWVPSETSTFMIVVPYNITFGTLRDRIDAKLARTANITLDKGGLKLQFKDDDTFISIQNDEDVATVFEIATDDYGPEGGGGGQFGEIELFCNK